MLNNLKHSLDSVGIPASHGYIKIEELEKKSEYDKLDRIYKSLNENKSCLFTDSDVVFLKNPLDYLFDEIKKYDLIIQSDVRVQPELKYFQKILNPGFCFVKPTPLTKELFDTSQRIEFLYDSIREDEIYFNSKLNTDKFKDLKVKILNEDEFCISHENSERFKNGLEPSVVHYNELPWRMFHPKNKIARMSDNNHWIG
jgi:hypothetical protein